jgi:predicted dehydrogenase
MGNDGVVRWGAVGAGRITAKVLDTLAGSDGNAVEAVASRDGTAARRLAAAHGVPRAMSGYAALVEDPGIDAVYVAAPNALHAEWVRRALEAGKHVLCEKPLGVTPEEVDALFDLADRQGLLLAEGFMYRHHDQLRRVTRLLADGAVGRVQLLRTCYSFQLGDPADIRLDAELEGGSLLDLGCYCINLSRLLGGRPVAAFGHAVAHAGGVDERFLGLLRFADDVVAQFDCGFTLPFRHEAEVVGTTGTLRLLDPWTGTDPVIVLETAAGRSQERLPGQDAYLLEFEDFRSALLDGRQPLLGRSDAVGNAQVIAALRRSAGSGTWATVGPGA